MAFCANCGTQMSDQARACPQCGHPAGGLAASPASIPNYLVQAILVTIGCCLPLGIVSIVYASQVNSKLAYGDIAGAQEASQNAKKWAWISFGVGLAIGIPWIFFNVFVAMNTGTTNF